mmetsp:Transcript_8508/g.28513  ORF Transcript_8508/g.28513 Transcript_8508/m.28513 type:complete len:87 (-) Transcript_8508:24-284(-)
MLHGCSEIGTWWEVGWPPSSWTPGGGRSPRFTESVGEDKAERLDPETVSEACKRNDNQQQQQQMMMMMMMMTTTTIVMMIVMVIVI